MTIVGTMDSGDRGMNLCRSDYHQSAERILVEMGIEPAIFCSKVLCPSKQLFTYSVNETCRQFSLSSNSTGLRQRQIETAVRDQV